MVRQVKRFAKKSKKVPVIGVSHVKSTFNNTIVNITDKQAKFAQKIEKSLRKDGFRVESDLRNEKITYKIRDHSMQRVPYLLIVGDKEMENNTVSVRARGSQDLGEMPLDEFIQRASKEIVTKN